MGGSRARICAIQAAHTAAPHQARHGPAATVRAYCKAINRHHYGRAWRLGGRYTGTATWRSSAASPALRTTQ
jgi:hypothetical protein